MVRFGSLSNGGSDAVNSGDRFGIVGPVLSVAGLGIQLYDFITAEPIKAKADELRDYISDWRLRSVMFALRTKRGVFIQLPITGRITVVAMRNGGRCRA